MYPTTQTTKGLSQKTGTASNGSRVPPVITPQAPSIASTIEDLKLELEARFKSAFEKALAQPSLERAEPLDWWDLFAIGPWQNVAPNGPLMPYSVMKVGETGFVFTVLVLNPSPILPPPPGMSPSNVMSTFGLSYEIQYQTGNLTTWALGPAAMNVTHPNNNLFPNQIVYFDVLQFTCNTPGIYEMNISARFLGNTPPSQTAPQFAGFATQVWNIDNAVGGFLGTGPALEYDMPVRFLVYP